jgi:hypothetical protein
MKMQKEKHLKLILISFICIWVTQAEYLHYDTHQQTIGFPAVIF